MSDPELTIYLPERDEDIVSEALRDLTERLRDGGYETVVAGSPRT